MKNLLKPLCLIAFISIFATSCTTLSRQMKEANYKVEFKKDDFTYSELNTGSAIETKILGIDWQRLFKKEYFGPAQTLQNQIPFVGAVLDPSAVDGYAMYDLMAKNPGYDVIFFPTFERKGFSIPNLYSKTEVKVTAKLGKLVNK
ncbi:MAG: hypothetical protein NTX03_03905 [Bacteroidetes bacterium]|nr:hypothetical protein [Bacteroidota bacterium]